MDLSSNVVVDEELAGLMHSTARLMVEASALIGAGMTHLERNYNRSNEPIIVGTINDMRRVSGDLASQWKELDQALANYEIII